MDKPALNLEDNQGEEEQDVKISIPVHLPTILLGIWKRRLLIMLLMTPLFVFSVIFAKSTRTRLYQSKALLLYEPPVAEGTEATPQLSLFTMFDIIKTPEIISVVREKIKLPARIKTISAAISIEIRKKTTLLEIEAEWPDPDIAADIANATYESFFENLRDLQNGKRTLALEELESRLEAVKTELTERDKEIKEFALKNNIVDLDKEAQAYLQQLVTLNTDYDRGVSHLESVKKQQSSLVEIISDLNEQSKNEANALASQSASITEANTKVQRLRERIDEVQTERARKADLSVKTEELKRAEKLRELDAISQSEYEKTILEFKRTEALTTDTPEITAWKQEIKKLDEAIVPDGGSLSTASAVLMQEMIRRSIDLKLEATAAAERVKALNAAKKRTQERLKVIPQVKQAYTEKLRRAEALANDRKNLQNMAASLSRQIGSSQIPFRVISRATPPLFHRKSNTKAIFIICFMMGSACIGGLILLLELRALSIKSRGSLAAALSAPPWAVLSHEKSVESVLPGPDQVAHHVTEYRRLLLEFSKAIPFDDTNRTVLVTETVPEAGATTVLMNMAIRLQSLHKSILIIDAHEAPAEGGFSIADWIDEDSSLMPGLADYLTSPSLSESELIQTIPGTEIKAITCSTSSAMPEMITSSRLTDLISSLKQQFSLIIIDAPALEDGIATEYLAQHADYAIYVTRSSAVNIFREKKAYKRLENSGLPIVGTVLTGVVPPYNLC